MIVPFVAIALLAALVVLTGAVWFELRELRRRAGYMPPPKRRKPVERKL